MLCVVSAVTTIQSLCTRQQAFENGTLNSNTHFMFYRSVLSSHNFVVLLFDSFKSMIFSYFFFSSVFFIVQISQMLLYSTFDCLLLFSVFFTAVILSKGFFSALLFFLRNNKRADFTSWPEFAPGFWFGESFVVFISSFTFSTSRTFPESAVLAKLRHSNIFQLKWKAPSVRGLLSLSNKPFETDRAYIKLQNPLQFMVA